MNNKTIKKEEKKYSFKKSVLKQDFNIEGRGMKGRWTSLNFLYNFL
jgi:hypothetical protein